MKKGLRILPSLLAALLLMTAAWADPISGENPFEGEMIGITWRDLGLAGADRLPVYCAPFDGAEQAGNGKAAVSTGEPFRLLGTLQYGEWGMIDYTIDSQSGRIGWIRLPETDWLLTPYGDLSFSRTAMRTVRDTEITDDPLRSGRTVTVIPEGETVIGMFMLTDSRRDWIYAETARDGRPVWGFVPSDALEDISETLVTRDGDTVRVAEGVTLLGMTTDYTYGDVQEGEPEIVARIEPGDIGIEYLDLSETALNGIISRLELPGSLRRIGAEGLSYGRVTELRLPGSITEVSDDALYGMRVDRMILAADYTGPIPGGSYSSVGRWETEDGNPIYRDIDGVLYSADGKVLLNYPSMRSDEHYDVPAGTEEIGDYAFTDSGKTLPLRSVSLPIGLKKIGKRAFSGCAYLISMTVPLTVKEIDPTAFEECVSLERLSLPPGMSAELSEWVQAEDFSAFRGDNGGTLPAPRPKEEWETEDDGFRGYSVRIDNEAGSGTVPVYEDEYSANIAGEAAVGTTEWVSAIRNGRACLWWGWIGLENAMSDPGDVFFTIADAQPLNPVRDNPEGAPMTFYSLDGGQACFFTPAGERKIPVRDTLLYRTDGSRTDRMGVIVPQGESVSLLDRPGGESLGHLYADMQVLVTEEDGGWLKVETGAAAGWIPREAVQIVIRKAE